MSDSNLEPDHLRAVATQQRTWAQAQGLVVDSAGYVPTFGENLREPMSEAARDAFARGSGGELSDTPDRRAKMRALHSSAALVVNVFDFWTRRDPTRLLAALGVDAEGPPMEALRFEEQLPTGTKKIPANIDILIRMQGEHLVGIESKFTEWMHVGKPTVIKPGYFEGNDSLWLRAGLPRCHALALAIKSGAAVFSVLDAPQLLKHTLGLRAKTVNNGGRFSLRYVYFDVPGLLSERHSDDIARFATAVGSEIDFRGLSYQTVFAVLDGTGEEDRPYRSYLRERYALG